MVQRAAGGWNAVPEALVKRACDNGTWLMLDRRARSCGLVEVQPLFLTALALGQLGKQGYAVLGRPRIAEVTGWMVKTGKAKGKPSRRVDTAIKQAVEFGALRKWNMPGKGLPCFAPGPGPKRGNAVSDGAHVKSIPTARMKGRKKCPDRANEVAALDAECPHSANEGRNAECPHCANPLSPRREPSVPTAQPECPEGANAIQESGIQEPPGACAHSREAQTVPIEFVECGGGDSPPDPKASIGLTPTTPPCSTEVRSHLKRLHPEKARRSLLVDNRSQAEKVAELLAVIGYWHDQPQRRADTVKAIVEHRAADATRWTLDELHDVARDPTTDVARVFGCRIASGKHDPASELDKGDRRGQRKRRPLHDAGAADRALNNQRRQEARADDSDGWLRDQTRGMLADRKPVAEIAATLGARIEDVQRIADDAEAERDSMPKLSMQHPDGMCDIESAKRIRDLYVSMCRPVPSNVLAIIETVDDKK